MLYIMAVLLAVIVVLLILIHEKLKLIFTRLGSMSGYCESAKDGIWTTYRKLDTLPD